MNHGPSAPISRAHFNATPGRRVLVLAPHLRYPARNGADILVDRKWSLYSRHADRVDILAMCTHRCYINGELSSEQLFHNSDRSRLDAALRTVLGCSHYLLQKNMTPEYCRRAVDLLSSGRYDTLVCSLITTAWPIVESGLVLPERCIIETHNDEIKWYKDIRQQSKSLPEKLAAFLSERWLRTKLGSFSSWLFIHVSEEDENGYNEILGKHRSIVVPVGTDVEPLDFTGKDSAGNGDIILLFSGSLSNNMNRDALANFESRYFRHLRERFGERLLIVVVGSNPSEDVRSLCARNGWHLKPDLNDEALKGEYRGATCSILPFEYATGGKLKLLKSLACGVPFLATTAVDGQLAGLPDVCLYSDDPNMWVQAVENLAASGVSPAVQRELAAVASRFSWDALARTMAGKIEAHFESA